MLGQALAQEFADEQLTAWDREDVDITDADQILEKVAVLRAAWGSIDVIINAAAYTAVDAAEAAREEALAVNGQGVANIAAAAKKVGATMVHYSTDYVFSGEQATGYAEDDVPDQPVNVYGESKLAGEVALRESGVPFYLVRTAWLYGPGGKNFVDTMLRLGAERPELKVIYDQQGSPTYTRDVAAATRTLLENHEPGIYHLTNSGTASWYEFAVTIFKLAGMAVTVTPITSAEYPLPATRPRFSALHNTKGPTLRDWREALAEYLAEKLKIQNSPVKTEPGSE